VLSGIAIVSMDDEVLLSVKKAFLSEVERAIYLAFKKKSRDPSAITHDKNGFLNEVKSLRM
jgi:hypothetical protein